MSKAILSGKTSGWHCDNPAGGTVTITVDNIDNQNEMKRIYIQITSSKQPTGVGATGSGSAPGGYTPGTFPVPGGTMHGVPRQFVVHLLLRADVDA